MMDSIRKNAQSWGIKVLFLIIIIVFVFWGVGSFRSEKSAVLAYVNEQPIQISDYAHRHQTELESLKRQNPKLTEEDLKQLNFRQQVFERMINVELLRQEAERLGFKVTTAELRDSLSRVPAFLDENGTFNPDRYRAMLQANQLSPAAFEADFAHDLLLDKVAMAAAGGLTVTDSEVRDLFEFVRTQAVADYAVFPAADFMSKVAVSDEEVATFYKENPDNFKIPASIKIDYILVSADAPAGADNATSGISTAALAEKLDKASEAISLGKSLKGAAEAAGVSVQSTDFFAKAAGPKEFKLQPEAVAALFELTKGGVTETPITVGRGFLLAQKTDEKPESMHPLEESKPTIVEALRLRKANEAAQKEAKDVLARLNDSKTAEEAVRKLSLKSTEPFLRQGVIMPLGFNPKLAGQAFAAKIGSWLPEAYQVKDGWAIVRTAKIILPAEEDFAAQRNMLRQSLYQSKQQEWFAAFMKALKAKADIKIVNKAALE